MSFFIDAAYGTLKKYGEELSGDIVNIEKLEDCTIIILADGLGSGVKANTIASLTSRIASNMLKNGANMYETVDAVANMLPVSATRKIPYSTFTIIKIYNNGQTYIAEYNNPSIFAMRNSKSININMNEVNINGKLIKESTLFLQEDDLLTIVSDGVLHAGLDNVLDFGWQREDVENYLTRKNCNTLNVQALNKDLLNACLNLYSYKPGDDTTVASIKVIKPSVVNIFTGPPENKKNDGIFIEKFMSSKGKKIICGGTAANIAQRELKRNLKVNLDFLDTDLPPTATMDGIDLITEGVLTLKAVVETLKKYLDTSYEKMDYIYSNKKNGADALLKILLEECTHLNLWVGKAENPAHRNLNLTTGLNSKSQLVKRLSNYMKALGKEVTINHI